MSEYDRLGRDQFLAMYGSLFGWTDPGCCFIRRAGWRILQHMVNDDARDRALYHALKAVDEVAAALQTHLVEDHSASAERPAAGSASGNSLTLLRQARERLGEGLRTIEAERFADADRISLRPDRTAHNTSE